MKKGILFTLGLSFLAISIFSLAMIIFHESLESEDVFLRFASLDRAYELDASLQNSIKQIFYAKSGMSISVEDSTISIQEYIPNQNKDQLTSALNSFRNYVESNDSNVDINVGEITDNMSFVIEPYNINYTHSFENKIAYIIPSEYANITSYVLNLDTGNVNFTTYSWDFVPSGIKTFEINVQDNSGNSDSDIYQMGNAGEHTLTVETRKGDIKIKIWDSHNLFINNTGESNLSLTTEIGFGELPNEDVNVILSGDIINIDLSDFDIKKKSGVRVI